MIFFLSLRTWDFFSLSQYYEVPCRMNQQLTSWQRLRFLPEIIARDGGYFCFYCTDGFPKKEHEFDHLNNKPEDNRVENLVLCHKYCNELKIHNFDWQIRAFAKLSKNVVNVPLGEREKKNIRQIDTPTEIDLNVAHRQITKEYIAERLPVEGDMDFVDTINCITFRCTQRTGHGSKQAIRNYLDELCCTDGPYQKQKIEGRFMISRREGT